MSASWPSSKKTFVQVVNGVTKLVALLFNCNYDETEALQTFLGASGNAQSKLAALNRLFKYMGQPLPTITWIDADTIEIAPCAIAMHSGNNYVFKENATALQIKLSVDLDTGSEASGTWYDVYLVGDGSSSTYTAKFVLQGNTPSGATYYKKIFTVRNDGSSNILKFNHIGIEVEFETAITITTVVSSGWSAAISCAAAIPAISTFGKFTVSSSRSSPSSYIYMRPHGSGVSSGPDAPLIFGADATSIQATGYCSTDGSQQINHSGEVDSVFIKVAGYKMNLLR